jgi:outer membrane scaffolding protein for murein synthesis (MipA/OmpV family)
MIRTPLAGLTALLAVWMPAALAQVPSALPEWAYSAGNLMRVTMEPEVPVWDVTLGLSSEYSPRYDGARDYHFSSGPMFDVRYRDLAFFSTGEGLGVNLLRGKTYRAGVTLSYDLGRRAESSSGTIGMGNISPAPEFKFFGEYMIFPALLRGDVRRGVGGQNGWAGDLGLYAPVYGSKKFFVFLGPSLSFADATYMRHYFGVSASQAADTVYPQYTASAGLNAISFGSSITWLITDHWLLNVLAGNAWLMGSAEDSPLALRKSQHAVALTLGYGF